MAYSMSVSPAVSTGITITGTSSPPQPQPALLAANVEELEKCVANTQQLVVRLSNLADRLIGSQPQAVEKDGGAANHTSMIGRLEAALNALERVTGMAHAEANRLERL